jgi:uncharacterized protein (DUF1330 family)
LGRYAHEPAHEPVHEPTLRYASITAPSLLARAMSACLVGQIRVTDAVQWQRYVDRVGATFAPHGGSVLFRGMKAVELARHAHGERIVVARFDSLAALTAWHESPEYQALVALREAGAEVVLTAYED